MRDGAIVGCTTKDECNAVMIKCQAAQSRHRFDVRVKSWPLDPPTATKEKSRGESLVDEGTATKGRELEKRAGNFVCLDNAAAAPFSCVGIFASSV